MHAPTLIISYIFVLETLFLHISITSYSLFLSCSKASVASNQLSFGDLLPSLRLSYLLEDSFFTCTFGNTTNKDAKQM